MEVVKIKSKENVNKKGEDNMENIICLNCKKENTKDANFCEYCGTKISEVCPNCWKKEGQPNSCPGQICE